MKLLKHNDIYEMTNKEVRKEIDELIREYVHIGFRTEKISLENLRRLLNDLSARSLLEDKDE